MSTLADLRAARSRSAAAVAAASVFAPISLVAWIAWQAIEGDNNTLTRSQFPQWAFLTCGAAVITCLAASVFWRTRRGLIGVALGTVLAVLAVLGGLLADVVGSGGLA